MEVSLSRLNDIIHVSLNRICLGIGVVGHNISYTACTAQSKKHIIIVIIIIIPGK